MTALAPAGEASTRSYSAALAALSSAQKPGHGVPAYTRYVNRWFGRRLAAAAYALGLRPNIVTLVSGAVSAIGIGMVATLRPTPLVATVAVFVLLVGYALDSADGQLARLTRTGSSAGEWLDHVVDAARLPLFHLAIAFSLFRSVDPSDRWVVALPLSFLIVTSVWFFGQVLADQLGASVTSPPSPDHSALMSIAKFPLDLGATYLTVLVLPSPSLFIPLYGCLFAATMFAAAVSLLRKFRQLSAPRLPDAAGRGS
jgi:phosphatidylglycerophosphate synthase